MDVLLRDPEYADRLAAFLCSVGRTAKVTAPNHVEVAGADDDGGRDELATYLSVWKVLYPDAQVEIN